MKLRLKSMFASKATQRGFTMIELLVVTTIIILLTTVGLVSYRTAGVNARNGKRKADMETVRQALVLYRTDNLLYPTGVLGSDFDVMVGTVSDYLSSVTVTDPKGAGHATYFYEYSSAAGRDFTLTAYLEPDADPFTLANP
jgi:prepilin-type N-terminal cleavage/methylation domain-containing protein